MIELKENILKVGQSIDRALSEIGLKLDKIYAKKTMSFDEYLESFGNLTHIFRTHTLANAGNTGDAAQVDIEIDSRYRIIKSIKLFAENACDLRVYDGQPRFQTGFYYVLDLTGHFRSLIIPPSSQFSLFFNNLDTTSTNRICVNIEYYNMEPYMLKNYRGGNFDE